MLLPRLLIINSVWRVEEYTAAVCQPVFVIEIGWVEIRSIKISTSNQLDYQKVSVIFAVINDMIDGEPEEVSVP